MKPYVRPLCLIALVAAAACGGSLPTPKPNEGDAGGGKSAVAGGSANDARAQEMFDSLCFSCHGATGHGDGPGAGVLNPKPRSFADPAWQASVTNDHIRKTIVYGGAAVGKSPMMPGQPQLKDKAAVLDGLVRIVRNFQTQ